MTNLNKTEDTEKQIAVVGDKDTILIFKSLGMDIFYESESIGIKRTLRKLVDDQYKIILITEKHAKMVNDFIQTRAELAYPIILPIPDGINNTSYAAELIAKNIEKALGGVAGGLK